MGPLICGFRPWSFPVGTRRFSMSCGINTGPKGRGALQPPFGQPWDKHSDHIGCGAQGEIHVVGNPQVSKTVDEC
jgi:hypothetical protein